MTAYRHRRTLGTFFTLSIVIAGTTAACTTPDPEPTPTPTQPPTVMADPTITWIGDIAPSSPLETDPAVQAARAGEIGRAMAFNTGDFTIRQLVDNVKPRLIDLLADAYTRQNKTPWVFQGPDPWEPIQINHTPQGVVITACRLHPIAENGTSPDPANIAGPYDRSSASTEEILLQESEGKLKIEEYDYWNSTACDGWSVPIGLFSPEPNAPEGPVTEPVRPPEGWTPGEPRE